MFAVSFVVQVLKIKPKESSNLFDPMSQCVVEYELSWLASYTDMKYIFTAGI